MSKTNILFIICKLIERLYTTTKSLFTIKQVELINKIEFAKAALNKNFETFVKHIVAFEASKIMIHFFE